METPQAIHTPEPHAGAPSYRAEKPIRDTSGGEGLPPHPVKEMQRLRAAQASVAASGPAFMKASASKPPFSNELRYKGKRTARRSDGFAVLFPLALWKKSAFADNTGMRRLKGTGPAAEQRRETFRVYAETSGRIAVDEHGTDLIKQLLFDAEMEFPHILGHVAFFRLVQSQFKRRAVSAAGTCFDTDRAFRLASPKRPQILDNGIGQGNHALRLSVEQAENPAITPFGSSAYTKGPTLKRRTLAAFDSASKWCSPDVPFPSGTTVMKQEPKR